MKTNYHEHHLRHLTSRVIAVIDYDRNVRSAVETLAGAGVAHGDLATYAGEDGIRQVDAQGVYSGGLKHIVRGLQRWTVEGDHLRQYEGELARGHRVLEIHANGRRRRDAIVQILRNHGAHFINAYGPWTIESVAA
jgi:hypothetical protein